MTYTFLGPGDKLGRYAKNLIFLLNKILTCLFTDQFMVFSNHTVGEIGLISAWLLYMMKPLFPRRW
jgi:hypothetical protein